MGAEVIAAGTVLQFVGKAESDAAEAKAERANAKFFREQADLIELSGLQEEGLLRDEGDTLGAAQMGAFAKAGVDFSGSALLKFEETREKVNKDVLALRETVRLKRNITLGQAQEAEGRAKRLRSFKHKFLSGGGTLLSGFGQAQGFSNRGTT